MDEKQTPDLTNRELLAAMDKLLDAQTQKVCFLVLSAVTTVLRHGDDTLLSETQVVEAFTKVFEAFNTRQHPLSELQTQLLPLVRQAMATFDRERGSWL